MKNQNILIAGAGVAGPVLAYWLARYGFSPTVVEQAPGLRSGGHAVDIRGAAREIAERMGAKEDVERARLDWHGMSYVDRNGRQRAKLPAELFGMIGDELAQVEILRADLVRAFVAAAQDGVEYIFGDSITDLTQDEDRVKVTFKQGEPRVFDLVIGADGAFSRVRSLVFGDTTVTHYNRHTAFFSTPLTFDGGLDGWDLLYNTPGRRLAMVRPGYSDGGTKALLSFAAGDLQYDRRDIQRQKEIVAKRFDGADWVVPEMLDAMWVAPDFSLGRDSLIRLPRWARGRAALVGDSAWASFAGHGTSFAVVGAYLLAGELKAAAGDHETAFARYEKLLRPYVDLGQQGPPGGDSMFLPKTRSAIWLRNQSIRALPHMPWRGLIAKGADKALAIPLPNYAN